MKRYEVTHVPHFIGGRLVAVGEVVTLPEGVLPGRYLVEVKDTPLPEPARSRRARADEVSDNMPDA